MAKVTRRRVDAATDTLVDLASEGHPEILRVSDEVGRVIHALILVARKVEAR